ncbi:MAG: hypothetical protein LBT18_01460 [Endomicrobium sp.]|jgi:hypothetical protein|nr:hypothetical protein [Endomicrobium sp.]
MVLSRDDAASMWRSMSLTVLFGTITGTMLTLLIIPIAYYLMENPRKSFNGMLKNLWFLGNFLDIMKKYGTEKIRSVVLRESFKIPRLPKKESGIPKIPRIKI